MPGVGVFGHLKAFQTRSYDLITAVSRILFRNMFLDVTRMISYTRTAVIYF
jgi:hypothetical protein